MKKLLVLLLGAALLLAACGKEERTYLYAAPASSGEDASAASAPAAHDAVLPSTDGELIVITERLFIAQTNDIYLNGEDYIGKTVQYEGMYKNSLEWDEGAAEDVIHYVIRYGPGCCGYDGEAGFEVRWEGEWPAVDDWVEVIGTLCVEEHERGYKIIYVDVQSLTVKTQRGAEYVST